MATGTRQGIDKAREAREALEIADRAEAPASAEQEAEDESRATVGGSDAGSAKEAGVRGAVDADERGRSAGEADALERAGGVDGIGARIKALREAMGLSLRGLADRCGVSAPMLSQIERCETSPTLAVAARVAEGLELSLSQLLRLDEGRHVSVVPAGQGRTHRGSGHRVEEKTPPLPGQRADVSVHELDPGASTAAAGAPPMHEPGSRETVVVLDGALSLTIDGAPHALGEGDAVTFDSDLPHHLENPGEQPARFVAVVAAGLRRS